MGCRLNIPFSRPEPSSLFPKTRPAGSFYRMGRQTCPFGEKSGDMTPGRFERVYECWGLRIHSELPCPELMEGGGEAEVFVRFGRVPERLPEVKIRGVFFEMNENEFLLKVDGVAGYWVGNGNEILIEPCESAEESAIRLFLLGSAFGALLHQRGLVPFHGSAVEIDGRAVMFVGPSGTGKSTLAAALCPKGTPVACG